MDPILIIKGGTPIAFSEQPDGSVRVICFCKHFKCAIQLRITIDQAVMLLSKDRPNIQDILPDVPREIREIFVSGLSPAELDMTFFGETKSFEHYRKLGYMFETSCSLPSNDTSEK